MPASSSSQTNFLNQTTTIIGQAFDYFTSESPEAKRSAQKNSDDCWYPASCQALANITPILVTSPIEYTKLKATADAAEVVSAIFREYADQELPQIYQAMNGSGGYNATTAQLLANDAIARAMAKASKEVLDNVQRYGNIRQGDVQALAQLYSSTKSSYSIPSSSGSSGGSGGDLFGGLGGIIGSVFGF